MDFSALNNMTLQQAINAGLVVPERQWDSGYNQMVETGNYTLANGTPVQINHAQSQIGGPPVLPMATTNSGWNVWNDYSGNPQFQQILNHQQAQAYGGVQWNPDGTLSGTNPGQFSTSPYTGGEADRGGFLGDTVFGSGPFKAASAVVGGLNLAGNYGYGPMANTGGGLTELGSASAGSSATSARPIYDTFGVGLEDPLVSGGGSLMPAAAAAGGAAGATAAGNAGGAAGGGTTGSMSPYQMGMLGLAGLSTVGGLASASRKPNVPGASPTAGFAGGGSPLNPNNPVLDTSVAKQAQDAAYAQAKARLDPQWTQAEQLKDTALRNQGLVPGTQAYDAAMRDFNFAKNDAYQQAYNTAYGQGLAAQGQGFNQAATNAGLTNQAANINNAFNQGTYNANVGSQNAMTQGLFGLGSTALSAYGWSNQNPVTNGTVNSGLYGVNSSGGANRTPFYYGG